MRSRSFTPSSRFLTLTAATVTTVVAPTTVRAVAVSPFSLRLDERSRARLAASALHRGESQSQLALRLIDEGLRMLDHPGVVFRDGANGRRAALVNGPDLWEVIGGVRGAGEEAELDAAAADLGLERDQIDTVLRYYADFRGEIDERIRRNAEEAERRFALFQQGRDAIA